MTKIQKPAEDKSAKHLEYFWEIICKVQEVQKALSIQETVLDNLSDLLKDLPGESEVLHVLKSLREATPQMYDKLGDVANFTDMLCRDLTEEKNILFSVMLDDLRMYSDTGRLHD